MEFGCHLPVYGPAATRETLLAFARRMEALGYDSLWASDHVVIPWRIASKYPYNETGDFPLPASANFLEPLTTLALVAGATERIRLGTTVLVLPHRHPLLAAKMLATLDHLAPGRARGRLARRVHERREDEGGARRAGGGVPRGRTRGEVPHAQRAPGPARPARRRGPRPRDPRAGRARCASPRPRIARARSRGHDRDLRALHPRRPREALVVLLDDRDPEQRLRREADRVGGEHGERGDQHVHHDPPPHVHAREEIGRAHV